jgi:hypothetical protein
VPSSANATLDCLVAATSIASRDPGRVTRVGFGSEYLDPAPLGPGINDPHVHNVPSVAAETAWDSPIATLVEDGPAALTISVDDITNVAAKSTPPITRAKNCCAVERVMHSGYCTPFSKYSLSYFSK